MSFAKEFLSYCTEAITKLDQGEIEKVAKVLSELRTNCGRLFIIGSGGGAGHASHAVCDFRKLCNIESYAPYDNISELTARVNDEGWDTSIVNWFKVSRLSKNDCVFVFSVGGGNQEKGISNNLVNAVKYSAEVGAKIIGIAGKDGGFVHKNGHAVILIPVINEKQITPVTEGLQALIWHLLVSHPLLQVNAAKWESTV